MTITDLIELARQCARARAKLSGRCLLIQRAVNRLKAYNLPFLRAASIAVRTAEDDLYRAIDNNRALFDKPRSLTVDDIRFGLRKQKGAVILGDEDKLIAKIRRDFPALASLPGADLKKLGVTITDATEEVLISFVETDAEKLAAAFLNDDAKEIKN